MAHSFVGNFRSLGNGRRPYFYDSKFGTATTKNSGFLRSFEDWASKAFKLVGGDMGYVSGSILHLYHGTKANRQYESRHELLIVHQFDPEVHLEMDGIIWRWSSLAGQELPVKVSRFLKNRNEDS